MTENPVCIARREAAPASIEALGDPSEPHPDEPGAPADAPARRVTANGGDEETALEPG